MPKKTTTKKTVRKKKTAPPKTTAQRLGAIIKSSRQIMRKDKGPGVSPIISSFHLA